MKADGGKDPIADLLSADFKAHLGVIIDPACRTKRGAGSDPRQIVVWSNSKALDRSAREPPISGISTGFCRCFERGVASFVSFNDQLERRRLVVHH